MSFRARFTAWSKENKLGLKACYTEIIGLNMIYVKENKRNARGQRKEIIYLSKK